jgi:hypothetical protein
LPLMKCSRRIRPIVSTVSIPPTARFESKRAAQQARLQGVNFGRRSPSSGGQNCTPKHTHRRARASPRGVQCATTSPDKGLTPQRFATNVRAARPGIVTAPGSVIRQLSHSGATRSSASLSPMVGGSCTSMRLVRDRHTRSCCAWAGLLAALFAAHPTWHA